jgi:hypothetical protein
MRKSYKSFTICHCSRWEVEWDYVRCSMTRSLYDLGYFDSAQAVNRGFHMISLTGDEAHFSEPEEKQRKS